MTLDRRDALPPDNHAANERGRVSQYTTLRATTSGWPNCSALSRRYRPSRFRDNSSWLPNSTTRPASITAILSAVRIVASRWATMKVGRRVRVSIDLDQSQCRSPRTTARHTRRHGARRGRAPGAPRGLNSVPRDRIDVSANMTRDKCLRPKAHSLVAPATACQQSRRDLFLIRRLPQRKNRSDGRSHRYPPSQRSSKSATPIYRVRDSPAE